MPQDPLSVFANTRPGHVKNPASARLRPTAETYDPLFSKEELRRSNETISSWPGYQPTRLVDLGGLARVLGVASIRYKDEAARFGLGSFKALGGAYAVSTLLANSDADSASMTVTSATDGNHGLSVAWGARINGCRCVIFIHAKVSEGREQALLAQGAEVTRIQGNYDESVRRCSRTAEEYGWSVISDTSTDNAGHEVARTVMAGYSVMVAEIIEQAGEDIPTHVFLQGGVGGLAATVCDYFRLACGSNAPRFIVVEPELAPCLFVSASNGRRTTVEVPEETMMAGLSCGVVSATAWPVLKYSVDDFLTVPDSIVAPTMCLLADAPYDAAPIIAGESAIAGLAGFICARQHADLASSLQLNEDSRILVIGTEGATDPDLYESITGRTPDSVQRANI